MRYLKAAAVAVRWQLVRRLNLVSPRLGLPPATPSRPTFRLPNDPPGRVAITIDDGPHPQWTEPMLEVLARHQVQATFFLVGNEVRRYPRLARLIAGHGHQLANHTVHHLQPFSALPRAKIASEIAEATHIIEDTTGQRPELFRAPAGSWSAEVLRTVADHGLRSIDWTVDPEDWRPRPAPDLLTSLARTRPGDIILCHDGGGDRSATVQAIDALIPLLRQRGLAFTTLNS
jgi:peptidoglycan/xylan/chitin deacetylase (PgdA/CDA1 family)